MANYTRDVVQYVRRTFPQWGLFLLMQTTLIILFTIFFFVISPPETESSRLARRSWGGWDERAETERCYKQERTATLLAFWLGVLGLDQWYARHWVLAVLKMLTCGGFGVWVLVDIHLWIVGGVYGTHDCPGGHRNGWLY